jgi:hypothetical protein
MTRTNNEKWTSLRKPTLALVIAMALWAMCGMSYAQNLIGSSGAGWQTWNLAKDVNGDFIDLNSNGYPYWDVPFLAFSFGAYGGTPAAKSVGWCMTSTGDCQGVGSALSAPGPIPFWGMPYNAASDSGGAIDPKVYFGNASGKTLQATLYLNTATNTREINEFGWFETNSGGTVNGTKHKLFQGTGFSQTLTPDPVGKTVTFTPTRYFGFYYNDVSDPQTSSSGCNAYTIFAFNDSDCTNASGQGDHVFAVFLQPETDPIYWVAGQDPSACTFDGDCNLTLVKVQPAGHNN